MTLAIPQRTRYRPKVDFLPVVFLLRGPGVNGCPVQDLSVWSTRLKRNCSESQETETQGIALGCGGDVYRKKDGDQKALH